MRLWWLLVLANAYYVHAQDSIFVKQKNGVRTGTVTEVLEHIINYIPSSAPSDPPLSISKSAIKYVRYANGSRDQFSQPVVVKPLAPAPVQYTSLPTVSFTEKGKLDAQYNYHRNRKTSLVISTNGVGFRTPLSPADSIRYDGKLWDNPEYARSYRAETKRLERGSRFSWGNTIGGILLLSASLLLITR